jgi:putative hydrolase of the HAD superfamily
MMPKYAVLWDADGVIFNSRDDQGAFLWQKTIEEDLGISAELLCPLWRENFIQALQGKYDTRLHIEECFSAAGITLPVEDFIAYWLAKDADINGEVLELVKRHPSHLATNQEPIRAAHLGNVLAGSIGKVFASSSLGVLKVDPAFFAFVEQDLNLSPEQLYFIDDTLENVEVAKSRSWNAYHFEGIHSLPDFLK